MIQLYLVRHGETIHNKERITQGQTDSPLSEDGKKQITSVADHFKNTSIDKIFTSDTDRAYKTAKEIQKYHANIEIIKTPILRERAKGGWEGIPKSKIIQDNPDLEKQWAQEIDVRPPAGENFEDVHKRVMPFVQKAIDEHPDKTLVFVTHGNVNRVIIGSFLEIPYGLQYRMGQEYTGISSIKIKGRLINVEYINKTDHLK